MKNSFDCYNKWLKLAEEINKEAETTHYKVSKGHALNNLGISKFWYFMEKTREMGELKESDQK